MNPVWSVILDILTAAGAMGGPLNGAKVVLIKSDFTPGRGLALADVTVADFDGYAASSAVVWGTSYIGGDGQAHLTGGSKEFLCTGDSVTNTIYGWGLVNSAADTLLGSAKYVQPQVIQMSGDGVVVLPDYIYGQ